MPSVVGKYTMTTSENFDEFMKALGIGMVMRNMAKVATPSVEISLDGATYTLKTSTTFKTTEIKFKLGEEFEETTADGRNVKSTITLTGDSLTHVSLGSKDKKEKDSTLVRVFKDDGFNMECKCDDVISTRFYKRND